MTDDELTAIMNGFPPTATTLSLQVAEVLSDLRQDRSRRALETAQGRLSRMRRRFPAAAKDRVEDILSLRSGLGLGTFAANKTLAVEGLGRLCIWLEGYEAASAALVGGAS